MSSAHAREADLGGGQEAGHALEHAQAGAQDGNDDRARFGELESDRRRDGGVDRGLGDGDFAGCLIGEEGDQLVNQLTEGRRRRLAIAQDGELVSDQGVVSYVEAHGYRLPRWRGAAHPGVPTARLVRVGRRGKAASSPLFRGMGGCQALVSHEPHQPRGLQLPQWCSAR